MSGGTDLLTLLCAEGRELLYPSAYRCLLCGKEARLPEDGICPDCRASLTRNEEPRELSDSLTADAVFKYEGAAREAMHRFKYEKAVWLAPFFARYMPPVPPETDAVIPVPMHPLKKYLRGYNPPELLAKALLRRFPGAALCPDLLRRTRYTRSQTKKTREERRSAEGLYEAASEVRGLDILLVDDVVTTGSTLLACAEACYRGGAKSVRALCACSAEKQL